MHKNLWPSVNQSIKPLLGTNHGKYSNTSPIFGKHPCFSLWGALPFPFPIWLDRAKPPPQMALDMFI